VRDIVADVGNRVLDTVKQSFDVCSVAFDEALTVSAGTQFCCVEEVFDMVKFGVHSEDVIREVI
jgi:hypothetical protein